MVVGLVVGPAVAAPAERMAAREGRERSGVAGMLGLLTEEGVPRPAGLPSDNDPGLEGAAKGETPTGDRGYEDEDSLPGAGGAACGADDEEAFGFQRLATERAPVESGLFGCVDPPAKISRRAWSMGETAGTSLASGKESRTSLLLGEGATALDDGWSRRAGSEPLAAVLEGVFSGTGLIHDAPGRIDSRRDSRRRVCRKPSGVDN